MHSETKFAGELNYTTQSVEEARKFLTDHQAEEIPCFMESFVHSYDKEEKHFRLEAEGQKLRFTRPAYLEFCSALGIPERFADKIPNDLLEQCVDQMLGDNGKVRLLVRDSDVICGVKKDNYVPTNPSTFFDAAGNILEGHLFREASITDGGTSLMFEPLVDQVIAPDLDNPQDRYNIGISFQLGYGVGLVEARPYSLRHVCTNVAISSADAMKHRLVEKLRRGGSSRYYGRLLENYTSEAYQGWMQEVSNRIAKALHEPLTDWKYLEAFNRTSKLLGKEVAWALLGVAEDRHDSIMLDIRVKKLNDEWKPAAATALEDLQLYDTFNQITAAGKTYSGADRVSLQEIGGMMLN